MKTEKTVYTVTNVYGINCAKPNHTSERAAIMHLSSMSGDGWIIRDQHGNQYSDYNGRLVITGRPAALRS